MASRQQIHDTRRGTSAGASFTTPTFEHSWYLIDQEFEEPSGLLQPAAGPRVGSHHIDTLTAQLGPLLQLVWGAGVRDVPHCRAAPIAWAVLVATFLASEIGPLLDLPRWVRDLSPFTHVLNLPGGEVTAGPLVALPAVAAALIAAGLWALNRRDLAVS